MTREEKAELFLIPAAAALTWLAAGALPERVSFGHLLLACAGLLLFQSLVRDLALLRRARREAKSSPKPAARCMCVESALGATGVVAGGAILASGYGGVVPMIGPVWALTVGLVMALGFAIKDLVFEWNPWRLRRDKDHMNIVFTLRK
ncbi:MAG: hypothetical protein R3174_03570 [Gammaproteobacteria bacterium]|nr:hypothetical protein [Gammaproteobacteria bacterium]